MDIKICSVCGITIDNEDEIGATINSKVFCKSCAELINFK